MSCEVDLAHCCGFMQAPFSTVHYELLQDAAAKRFFLVNGDTGDISVRRDLATDSSQQYTVSADL